MDTKKKKKTKQTEPENNNDEEEAEYFERVVEEEGAGLQGSSQVLFSQLSLSRPLLRAVERTGYVSATPIQAQTIPYALAGKDICASAETGSGKTAAFVLPFLERLLYRPRDVAAIRVLVITPTRELAQQIHVVLERLAQFTDVTSCLICGGKKDVRSQETTLRQRPDVVVSDPFPHSFILQHSLFTLLINHDAIRSVLLDVCSTTCATRPR